MPPSKDAEKNPNTNRLSSGIEELDHILGGGFPARRLFLIEGAPGTHQCWMILDWSRRCAGMWKGFRNAAE
jgi:predicted ATP-dependent serine protease